VALGQVFSENFGFPCIVYPEVLSGEVAALLTYFLEVPILIPTWDTDYPDSFLQFSVSHQPSH
jgi:hypothetical protein